MPCDWHRHNSPLLVLDDDGIQVEYLLIINLFSIIIYGNLRSHYTQRRRNIEFSNDMLIMVIVYTIMLMTDFNRHQELIFLNGYSFECATILLVLLNIGYITLVLIERIKNKLRKRFLYKIYL